jgi:isopenicillin N synthase-like dioxygenase
MLNLEVLSAIAIGLGLQPRYFDNFCNKMDNNLRLLHYPSVPKTVFDKENQARAGAHTGNLPKNVLTRQITEL